MAGRQCHHCKAWIEDGEAHDCWSTTEQALTADLSDDLRDAWERLRETAAAFGDQRIYASHHSIMFARRTCYFFSAPISCRDFSYFECSPSRYLLASSAVHATGVSRFRLM